MPAEPARGFFASIIAELAARFDAPIFEPHVTIYVTRNANDIPAEILKRVLTDYQVGPLSIRDLQYSDIFTKTVFVQFEPSPQWTCLSDTFQQASKLCDSYDFNPHLSLIYKEMNPSAKIDLITSIHLPFNEVRFDVAKAVICPMPTNSRQDVENWRVVAAHELTN